MKYDALDRTQPFTRVQLKRDDLFKIWPRVGQYAKADEYSSWPIEASMLKPISEPRNSGYVPLCSALQWIMSDGGKRLVMMDQEAWDASVGALWPFFCTGEVEMIGLAAGATRTAPIPGNSLALVKVLRPLHVSISEILASSPSRIQCTPYTAEHWQDRFNDRLYETGHSEPTWSHLQIRKSHLLARWPRSSSSSNVEQDCYRWLVPQMQASPLLRPKSRAAFWADAKKQFPKLAERQFLRVWQRAISDTEAHGWSKSGRPKSKRNAS